jgi:hypothetical protein
MNDEKFGISASLIENKLFDQSIVHTPFATVFFNA